MSPVPSCILFLLLLFVNENTYLQQVRWERFVQADFLPFALGSSLRRCFIFLKWRPFVTPLLTRCLNIIIVVFTLGYKSSVVRVLVSETFWCGVFQ